MFKILMAVFVAALMCGSARSEYFAIANGQLVNCTPVPILTWNDGYYAVCQPGTRMGRGESDVVDCDWYFNPYTMMWVKLTPDDNLTLYTTLYLTPETEEYNMNMSLILWYAGLDGGTGMSVSITPRLKLPRGPNTPEEWTQLRPEHHSLLLPQTVPTGPGVTSQSLVEPIDVQVDGITGATSPLQVEPAEVQVDGISQPDPKL